MPDEPTVEGPVANSTCGTGGVAFGYLRKILVIHWEGLVSSDVLARPRVRAGPERCV